MARLILASIAIPLACCTPMEGDGFFNTGRPSKPVVCETVSPMKIECRTVKYGKKNIRRDPEKDH